MDPGIAVGIGILSKIIGLSIKGMSAVGDHDLNKDDLEALRALLDTGASVLAVKKPASAETGVLHLALIAHSFGRAVARHQEFHGKIPLPRGLFRWWSGSDEDRQTEIKQRVKLAALSVRELGNDPRGEIDRITALTSHPLATPYYCALWHAFSSPDLTIEEAGEQPPLVISTTLRREFERYFLLAYLEGMSTPGGAGVDEYLDGLKQYRSVLVRDLLLSNLATWGQCHVFGNTPRHAASQSEALPFMPLDEVYVEPDGYLDRDGAPGAGTREPILALIKRLTAASAPPRLVLVVADFGSGKSLTARTLARRWAEQFRASTSGTSLDLPLPIHVRCADDFPSETVDVELTVRRAWKRQATAIDYSVSEDDAAFAWPNPEQHVMCLLDGLDEVALGEQHLKALFQKLCAKTTRKHRFVVFTRPGALPEHKELSSDITVVRVQPFDTSQIERWLTGWARLRGEQPPLTRQQLEARSLASIAQTPILLFMIAFTWQQHAGGSAPPSLAEIYEHFFCQVAAGKAATDREEHRPIARASDELRAALVQGGLLADDATETDAMLWLMGRVAWEAHTLEQRPSPEPLTRWHLDSLLKDPLVPIPATAANTIRIGLILALQADLHSANHTILFGHQSFREFLVGRYWAGVLKHLVHGRRRDHDRWIGFLRGGRLLSRNSKALDFLMAFINHETEPRRASPLCWDSQAREELVAVMQDIFEDERQVFGERVRTTSNAEPTLRNDQNAELRAAALAIGSLTRGSRGMLARDPLLLRSMLAWFWLEQQQPRIVAIRGQFRGAQLHGADLHGSELAGVDLSDADLSGADIAQCDLAGAQLARAQLVGADLRGSDLSGVVGPQAQFDKATLNFAILDRCNLHAATFGAATLVHTRLQFADLSDADFSLPPGSLRLRTVLWGTVFRGANLTGASFAGAQLDDVELRYCDLRAANLRGAVLHNVDLRGSDLRGADLRGTDLRSARLDVPGAPLPSPDEEDPGPTLLDETTLTDDATRWPDGFDLGRTHHLGSDDSPSQSVALAAPPVSPRIDDMKSDIG